MIILCSFYAILGKKMSLNYIHTHSNILFQHENEIKELNINKNCR